jgi:hypothetical protein
LLLLLGLKLLLLMLVPVLMLQLVTKLLAAASKDVVTWNEAACIILLKGCWLGLLDGL